MKDIEIILIDDFSKDNSVSIIEKYMKEDPRIKLIKNKNNRKILYTKSIGALNAKGKYIFQFDQDDILIRDDVFDLIYYEAENNDLDLVQFRDIIKRDLYFNKRERVNCKFRHMLPYKETHIKASIAA
jgi:glycosyltransferase involved in cell wall biosynthesis